MGKYILSNHGEYVSSYDNYGCSWTFLENCAKEFDTYAKARYAMTKINKSYGFARCRVIKKI